jgi:hypothetical protein
LGDNTNNGAKTLRKEGHKQPSELHMLNITITAILQISFGSKFRQQRSFGRKWVKRCWPGAAVRASQIRRGRPCAIWSEAEEAVVLPTLQGKGLCGKEAFLLT